MEEIHVGIKTELFRQEKCWLDLGLLGRVGLPFATSETYRTHQPPMSILLLAAKDLNTHFSIGANAGLSYTGEDRMIYPVTLSASLSLPYQLACFFESAVIFSEDQMLRQHIIDGGTTWQLNEDLQFDLSYGRDIRSGYWFTGTGISWRFKKNE